MKKFLQMLISRSRISRVVLFGCALVLAVLATVVLPEGANAQAVFATSKNICIGVPDPNNNNPNTCPTASIVGVGQPVFYVIKVTSPPGSSPQQITLTENYPTGFVPVAIVCTDQSGATITVAINGPAIGPFNLPLDTTVTCTIAGAFTAAGLTNNIVDVDNKDGPVQHPSVPTTVAQTTQLTTDLSVTKTESPSPIGVTTAYPLPATVTYTVTIKNNGPNAVDVGHWFVLHDTLALLPGSVPLYATLQTAPNTFSCTSSAGTDCLDPAGPTPTPPGQQLIGTMAPHPMFDWSFPSSPTPGYMGHIAVGGTIMLTWKVKIEKLPTLSCVISLTSNGLKNQAFFTLTNPDGTAANDINNANNTASAPLSVKLTGTVNPNCGAGQLTFKKTQVTPPPGNQALWGMPPWLLTGPAAPPPLFGTVTYDITIKNTAMPAQTITIPGSKLEDFVIEGIGTPPFTRTFVSAVCLVSVPASTCTAFNLGGGGNPPPPAPFPSPLTQTQYTFYGQQQLGWSSKPTKALPLGPGDSVTIRIKFNYYGPDCQTVPNVTPKLIDNKAQITYMATAVGAASGSQQNVQYTQVAIAHTQMKPQPACKFVVTKKFHPGSSTTVQFGGPPLVYDVTFTNNDVSRNIGTVMDSVRLTNAAYATQVPFTSSWVCTQTGGVTPLPIPAPPVNGTAIYTGSPAQGSPVFQFTNLHFNNGAQLTCTVTITVDRPLPNNPNCSMNLAYFENLALMDVTHPFNTNVPWPPSGIYNPGSLSNPTPQDKNWATLQAPLPKCYDFNIYKTASVNGFSPAWTYSPGGPPVQYSIAVTNTGTSGTLTGSAFGPPPGWNGLRVEDVVAPPYNTNLINGASCVPGSWCTLLMPPAPPPQSPSYAGVLSLAPSASGVWKLTLNPPFTTGQTINNCASVTPQGTFTGPDYYSNYSPANPPPPSCFQVPVLTTVPLGVTKIIVNETGHALNIPPTASGVHVACQTYPLLSSGNLTLPVGGALGLANGGSVSGPTGFVLNVPVAPGETCTVTEPTLPAISPGACGRDTVAYWDTTISPAQPTAITTGSNAVTVTNRLRCRPNLSVTKTFVNATGSPIPIQPPTFNVNVTCNPLSITPTNLALTPPATATSSSSPPGIVQNVPVGPGETCTVTEPVLPAIPALAQQICGNTAYWDSSPAFTPSQTIPISATGPNAVTVTNTLKCDFGYLAIYKVYHDQTGGTTLPTNYTTPPQGFPIGLSCPGYFPGTITVPVAAGYFSSNDPALTSVPGALSMSGPSPSTGPSPAGIQCTVNENNGNPLPPIQTPACPFGNLLYGPATWTTTYSPSTGTVTIPVHGTAVITVTNTLTCVFTQFGSLTVGKNFWWAGPADGNPTSSAPATSFTVDVVCTTPSGQQFIPAPLVFNFGSSGPLPPLTRAVPGIPVGSVCKITEQTPPPAGPWPPCIAKGVGGWEAPTYPNPTGGPGPVQSVTIQQAGQNLLLVRNSFVCSP